MVISCSVPTCKNRFQKGGEIQFHSFPLRREDMCRRWAEAIGRHDWLPTKNSFVCSQHFTMDDYQIRAGKNKHFLRESACPSIFPPAVPRKRTWRQATLFNPKRLPFLLPSHLEVSCSTPLQRPSPPPPPPPSVTTAHPLLPTYLPSGVSIVPLKKIQPKLEPVHTPVRWGDSITFEYPQIKHEDYNTNGHKRLKPEPKLNKPMPQLNPIIKPKPSEDNDELDVTQFLSVSLENPQDDSENLKQKCLQLEKQLQRREYTIKQMNLQIKSLRKKMDGISVHKILQENFNGLTYDILNCYLNNTNLDAYEKRYDDNVKRFAMKLFDISEEAYGTVREQFDLPHPSNVSHWLRASEDQDLDEVGLDLSPNSLEKEEFINNGDFEYHNGDNCGLVISKVVKEVPKNSEIKDLKISSKDDEDGSKLLITDGKYSLDDFNITMEPVDSCE